MINKKTKILIGVLTPLIILSIAAGGYFLTKSKPNNTNTSNNKSEDLKIDTFGYHALKFNGEYVSEDIFTEEKNKFFEKWSTNAEMLYKTDEERDDMLLDVIIERLLIEYYVNNNSDHKVTQTEIDDYTQKYIDKRYASQGGVEAYMQGMGFKTKEEMNKNTEFYIKKLYSFSKIAPQYGFTLSASELDKEYEKHTLENTFVIGKRIHISSKNRSKEEALKIATDIYTRIKNGESIDSLGKEKSEDTEGKLTGYTETLENISGNIYSDEFDKVVFSANPGTLLEPINNMIGYDVIYVENFNKLYHPKEEYKKMLLVQRFGESDKLDKWLEDAKKTVTIEITDSAFKAYRLFKDKKYKEAAECYKSAYDETKNVAHIQKAYECYKNIKDWENVIKVSEIGMEASSDHVEFTVNAAEGYFRINKKDDAEKLLKKAEKKSADSMYLKQLVLSMYSTLGYKEDAERLAKEIGAPAAQ